MRCIFKNNSTIISILFAAFTVFACVHKNPEFTIDKTKMIDIIADLHVAEELISKFRQNEKDSVRIHYLLDISKIYEVDTSDIFKNINIIQSNPELASEIYSEAFTKLDSLTKTEDKKEALQK